MSATDWEEAFGGDHGGDHFEPREDESFPSTTVIREADSGKAILVRFKDGKEKWVPKSQITDESEIAQVGEQGTLVITEWLAGKWAEEEDEAAEPPVSVSGVVCLKQTDRALMVRIPGMKEPIWIPTSHVIKDGEVQGDGDVGILKVTAWIAAQKGLNGQTVLSLGGQSKSAGREVGRTAQDDLSGNDDDDDDGIPF